jgi:TonB family protein
VSTEALQNPISRSLAIHAFLLILACFYVTHAPKLTSEAPVEVTLVDEKDQAKPEDAAIKQIIVQKSEGDLTDKAKKDAYLSDKTRTVREERSAKKSGDVGSASAVPPRAASKPEEQPGAQQKSVELSDLGVKISPKAKTTFEKDRHWATPQLGEGLKGGQYIQGMKEGETSALNTKEFVFFSYFDRVRRQLDQAWQPILRQQIARLYKAGRRLASNSDYTTRTMVTLDQRGQIVRVQVLEQSGTFDLDEAAIDALNKAGPYPNPPRGLVDGTGKVQIRWDFILKT